MNNNSFGSMGPFGAPLFDLGNIYITVHANAVLADPPVDLRPLINRHHRGDWLEMAEDDQLANRAAVTDGSRVFSRFTLPGGRRVWIITEAEDEHGHRSHTTVLMPEDY